LPFEARWTPEVYYDILCGIHRLHKKGQKITMSRIGHEALVPNNRLKNRLVELRALGLVDEKFSVTRVGYSFCNDYLTHIDQVLRKYGLYGER
jgi:hypothetical protein